MRAPFVVVTLAFIAGVLWAPRVPCAPMALFVIGLGGAVLSLGWPLISRRASTSSGRLLPLLGAAVVWACLGWLRAESLRPDPQRHLIGRLTTEPRRVILHGIVADDPTELFSPDESEKHVAVVQVLHGRFGGAWQPIQGLVRSRIRGLRGPLAYGDELLIEGDLSAVPSPGNPGQFDWRAALARNRIYALMSVAPHQAVVRLRSGQGRWWWRAIYALRHRCERLLQMHFDDERAGLLRSLLLGERTRLDERLKQAFVETGTIHLLVISGFNVGLIAWLLELGLRLTGAPRLLRWLLCAVGVLGYCLLTGMQPPVTRATIMAWIVLGAMGLDRVVHWPNTVAAAALAILMVNPAQLFDASFQLSFGAVLSLLVLTSRLSAWFASWLSIPFAWLQRYLALGLASTCAVWIGLWPVLAWYFHLISPVSIVANLVLVPLVSLLVGVGTVLLMLGTLAAPVISWTAWPLARLLDATVWCVHRCHAIPWGHRPVGHPSWWLIAGYYGVIILSLLRRQARLTTGRLLAVWLVGLNLWIWSGVAAHLRPSPWLEVTVLDVGRGASLLIRTPSRQAILVDTGPQDAGRYDVVPFLRARGIQTLDALILTQFDEGHIGGAVPVLQQVAVRRLFTNGAVPMTPTARRVFQLVAAQRIPHERVRAGQQLTGLVGVEMMVLSNEPTLVLRLVKGRHHLFLPLKSQVEQVRRDGAITIRTDGARLAAEPFRGGPRAPSTARW